MADHAVFEPGRRGGRQPVGARRPGWYAAARIDGDDAMPDARQPFGSWLLQQSRPGETFKQLIEGAKADRGFPRNGDPDAVRKRLGEGGAEGDLFDLIDDLETDWLAL